MQENLNPNAKPVADGGELLSNPGGYRRLAGELK